MAGLQPLRTGEVGDDPHLIDRTIRVCDLHRSVDSTIRVSDLHRSVDRTIRVSDLHRSVVGPFYTDTIVDKDVGAQPRPYSPAGGWTTTEGPGDDFKRGVRRNPEYVNRGLQVNGGTVGFDGRRT